MRTRHRSAATLLISALLATLLAACSTPSMEEALETETWAPRLQRAARAAWMANGAHYHLHHVGQEVSFQGKVRNIGTRRAQIVRDTAWHAKVICHFASQHELAGLQEGQRVRITGRLGYPETTYRQDVTDCRLRGRPESPPK